VPAVQKNAAGLKDNLARLKRFSCKPYKIIFQGLQENAVSLSGSSGKA